MLISHSFGPFMTLLAKINGTWIFEKQNHIFQGTLVGVKCIYYGENEQ